MKTRLFSRILAMLLVVSLIGGFAVPVNAAGLSWRRTNSSTASVDLSDHTVQDETEETAYKATDYVRVSIVLEGASTIQAGYSTTGIAQNEDAMAYRDGLEAQQEAVARKISQQVLHGKKLDVVWNMTLVGNIISANVAYGDLDDIRAVEGVESVTLETWYEPSVYSVDDDVTDPQMYTSSGMIGSNVAWAQGYTGAGSRVAIIDTGTDSDHQSFSAAALQYALERNAEEAGLEYDDYVDSLNLLDQEEIASVLTELNAYGRDGSLTAEDLYGDLKLAFGYNYIDGNLNITHDLDSQGGHGSHVAGIAAGNRYIQQSDGSFASAADTVYFNGVAPDAQIITLKVFGAKGGAYDSDYMAAIEDAIVLGCDAVNLSLGSANPGSSYTSSTYAELLDMLTGTDTVVVMSAGNSGTWAENAGSQGYLYNDDVSLDTVGSPGSYFNSLAVASVENAGTMGTYFQVEDLNVIYNETTGYGNSLMATLDTSVDGDGTTFSYVFVDGFGVESDYEGIDLTGKVVFCSRGSTSFYEKANVAAAKGASAIVIYNNQDGAINMQLTGYNYTAPCVSILQSEGAAIKELSSAATTDAGLNYYTGDITVFAKVGVTYDSSEYYTMSTFSSWGVPGSLSLKPEITAPGGEIYSVNGETSDTDQYLYMSGTSMAAPQVTGMTALVAQYIRENDLAEKTGLTIRALSQSLLMSTAEPLLEEASDGNYYSLLTQGAGLARVDLATGAESYILVDGQEDGKVKVELGDDPDRLGQYVFSFSINNLTEQDLSYAMSADVFTQDIFSYDGILYMDTWTAALAADTAFACDGAQLVSPEELAGYDMNGDGSVDADDADYLLEYLLGNESELMADGDVNGDGEINTYDAHILLTLVDGKTSVEVPAGGSAQVEVTITLPQEVMDYLNLTAPNGAYIEAFVYAEPVADQEGVSGVTHSIPVLGFFGSWTEASMYDVGTYQEYSYGTETRSPYLSSYTNTLTVQYSGSSDEYYFGGNPISDEAEYLPERNAFNNEYDVISRLIFTQIRNAGDAKLVIANADTGEVYLEQELGEITSAYYYVNGSAWRDTQKNVRLNWAGTDADGEKLPEGTTVEISLITAPEYYRNDDGSYDWDALGDGAYLTNVLTVDNTAPEISDILLSLTSENELRVTAQDNQYIAAVLLCNAAGTKAYDVVTPDQTEAGQEQTVSLSLASATGSEFQILVYDYAMNVSTYTVKLSSNVGGDVQRPYFTSTDRTNVNEQWTNDWVGFDAEDGTDTVTLAAITVSAPRAAEYVDGYVFEISNDNDLLVASDDDLSNFRLLGNLDSAEYPLVGFNDLAYNYADGKLYGLFYSYRNNLESTYLCTIDVLMGTMDVIDALPISANTLAIDGEGNFYSTVYNGSTLYTYTAETYDSPVAIGNTGRSTTSINTMAWDHNTDTLYWSYTKQGYYALLEVDTETAATTQIRRLPGSMVGLYIRPVEDEGIFAPTDQIGLMEIDPASTTMLVGSTRKLSCTIRPWTVKDDSVTWSSSDTSVATVNANGLVSAVANGTATITATSVMDPSWTAECAIEVTTLEKELNGIVWDENGQVWWSSFRVDSLPNYTKLTESPSDIRMTSAAYGADGTLYGATLDTETYTSAFYAVNPETFEATIIGQSTFGYMDLAAAPSLGDNGMMLAVYGANVLIIKPDEGIVYGGYDWSEGMGGDYLVGIAYYGTDYNTIYNEYYDMYLLIDDMGNVYLEAFIQLDGSYYYFQGATDGYLYNLDTTTDVPYFNSAYFDGSYLYWSRYAESDDRVDLIAWDCEDTGELYSLGSFADTVWPVGGLFELESAESGSSLSIQALTVSGTAVSADSLEFTYEGTQKEAGGSLNATTGLTARQHVQAQPYSVGSYDEETASVSVEITATQVTTNGRFTISFDAEKLTLIGISSPVQAFASASDSGSVEFAYASATPVAEGGTLAILTFQCAADAYDATELTVNTTECGDQDIDDTEAISVTLPHQCFLKAFTDLDAGRWYHESVDFVVANGLMAGVETDLFQPYESITRAQFVSILYRLAGEPAVTGSHSFTDVSDGKYYSNAVTWAYTNGIVAGVSEELFKPNEPVTRQQMALLLMKYAQWAGVDVETSGNLEGYSDASDVSNYARNAMIWAVENGILVGTEEDILNPTGDAYRVEAAAIFMRYVQTFNQ